MRAVLDTNILISALIGKSSPPAQVLDAWLAKRFALVTSEAQLDELRRVSRYERIKPRLKPHLAGELVNRIHAHALLTVPVILEISPDPDDNLILGTAVAATADYLVTGDKSDLLKLERVQSTLIVSARDFVARL